MASIRQGCMEPGAKSSRPGPESSRPGPGGPLTYSELRSPTAANPLDRVHPSALHTYYSCIYYSLRQAKSSSRVVSNRHDVMVANTNDDLKAIGRR